MDFTGKVIDASRALNGHMRLLIEADSDITEEVGKLLGYDRITARIGKYKAKRSLDANAYYWVLVGKLAKALQLSNSELHNYLLADYGQPWIVGDALHRAMLPDTDDVAEKVAKASEYHLRPTTQVTTLADGKDYRTYITMRGSSSYNTEEMARLIDGTISECRAVGMTDAEIMSPEEKRILKERYGIG